VAAEARPAEAARIAMGVYMIGCVFEVLVRVEIGSMRRAEFNKVLAEFL
jgi:hypothetical protein